MYNSIDGYIYTLVEIYTYMLIAYVLLSWLPAARDSFVGEILGKLCEPYLGIFRRFIPPIGGMIDISPIIALIALRFVGEGIRAIVNFFV
ncbi:YggT family protein [Paenibacillus sp. NPDC056579]|uniref:YggT family protein n=1 Tax=unclassified Paenibacillus TaxID=185978 RepID=UPI001EF7C1D8|nr:YggT family protein [Paenibacillus sp. H1-7]ULL17576.1 YggT family protein [Paenibacillus sp. H1-7]